MIQFFHEQAEIIKKKPEMLANVTHRLIYKAARQHHQQNKMLPAADIQQLINILIQYTLINTNADAAYHILAANCLVLILKVNFNQLAQNKLYQAVVLQYGQTLEKIVMALRTENSDLFVYTKLIARGIVASKIILKLIQRTHAFVPQFYRFARISMDLLGQFLEGSELESIPLTEKENSELLIIRMCLSKKVTREYLVYMVNCLQYQIRSMSSQCPSSAKIDIISVIKAKIQQIREKLSEDEKILLGNPDKQVQEDQNVYIQEPIRVRQLTPRMYDQEKAAELLKLRRKKQKLTKNIQLDLKKSVQIKQQEIHAIEDVRRERGKRQQKKELFVLEKQTAEAKKYHKKEKKVKMIKKTMNNKGNTQKSKLDALSRSRKKKK